MVSLRLLAASQGTLNAPRVIALTLPWLMPFAGGPSPAVVPWLMTLLCVAGLVALVPLQRPGLPVALLFGAMAAAIAIRGPDLHLATLATLIVLGCGVLCAGLGAAAIRDGRLVSALATAWLLAALLSSLMALCQYFNLAHYLSPWLNEVAAHGAAYANLRQRNQFATLTSMGLAALCWFTGRGQLGRHAPWMLALLALGNVTSASRTGMAQWILLVGLGWFWRGSLPPVVKRVLWSAIPFYLLAFILLWLLGGEHDNVFSRLDIRAEGCYGRRYLWSNVLDLIAQRPWIGWGWRDLAWAHYMGNFPLRFCDIPDNAHNLPLQLAVELGLPAALLIGGGLAAMVVRAKPWRETDRTRQLAWCVLALLLLHSLLEYPLWYGPFQMAFGISLGLLWPAKLRHGGASDAIVATVSAGPMIAAFLMMAGTAYAALDYHRISQVYLAPEQRDANYRDDTLAKVRRSWLFASQVKFAELALTPLTPANAAPLHDLARELLHYSPEPRVIEKLIESAELLGLADETALQKAHYKAAFPGDYQKWSKARGE